MTYPDPPLPVSVSVQNDLQRAIHRHHWNEREHLIQALGFSYHKSARRQAQALSACAESARLFLDVVSGEVRTLIHRCRNRLCPWCTHARTAKAKVQILGIMGRMAHPRTMVLTPQSVKAPLSVQLRELRASFVRLRRDRQWKRVVKGGVYTLEVTWNAKAETWHPHIHLIVDGEYFPQGLLSRLWNTASRGASIVWIKAVENRDVQAMELAGYIGKPPKVKDLPGLQLREYATATRGLRMLSTFGVAFSVAADDGDPPLKMPLGTPTLTVSRIRYLARRGCSNALLLADLVVRKWPVFERYFVPSSQWVPGSRPPLDPAAAAAVGAELGWVFRELYDAQCSGALGAYDIWDAL